MARKTKISLNIDPEYLKKQKAALVRRHRQVIYLNDSEMAAIREYCEKFRVNTKSALFRRAIMEKVLKELDEVFIFYHKACGVVIRMKAQHWSILKVFVKEQLNVFLSIIDKAEW